MWTFKKVTTLEGKVEVIFDDQTQNELDMIREDPQAGLEEIKKVQFLILDILTGREVQE